MKTYVVTPPTPLKGGIREPVETIGKIEKKKRFRGRFPLQLFVQTRRLSSPSEQSM